MDILDLVCNTPMARLRRLVSNPKVEVYAKLEGNNPGGSVKDRAAKAMIEGAERRGLIKPGVRIVEPTSGNTGIALAMIACLKGIELELVMPASATPERVATMRAYGATVTLTPRELGMEGTIDHARALVAKGGCFMLDQFSNPDNPEAHYRSTGPEIWRDTEGRVTHFVSSMGTTGTIMGTSRFLKEKNPAVQIVGCQPTEGSNIPGIRRWPTEYLPKVYDAKRVDRVMDISQAEAEHFARRLCREEGIFAGISSGGTASAAVRLAQELQEGVIVFIVCDRGDKYLSTPVFG